MPRPSRKRPNSPQNGVGPGHNTKGEPVHFGMCNLLSSTCQPFTYQALTPLSAIRTNVMQNRESLEMRLAG